MGDTAITIPYTLEIYLNGVKVEEIKEIASFSLKIDTFSD